jgi:plasmid maintenance system antidote protein VapI
MKMAMQVPRTAYMLRLYIAATGVEVRELAMTIGVDKFELSRFLAGNAKVTMITRGAISAWLIDGMVCT